MFLVLAGVSKANTYTFVMRSLFYRYTDSLSIPLQPIVRYYTIPSDATSVHLCRGQVWHWIVPRVRPRLRTDTIVSWCTTKLNAVQASIANSSVFSGHGDSRDPEPLGGEPGSNRPNEKVPTAGESIPIGVFGR